MKKDKILDELAAAMPATTPPGPDEFTVDDWMSRRAFTFDARGRQGAYRELDQMVSGGILKVRKGKVGSKNGNIYRKAKA